MALDIRVFGKSDGRGTIVRSEELVEFYPDRETADVVVVDALEDAIAFANVATLTVGVYPEHCKAQVRDGLMDRRVQRVVPLCHAIDGPHTPHDGMYSMHRFVKWVVQEGKLQTPAPNAPVDVHDEAVVAVDLPVADYLVGPSRRTLAIVIFHLAVAYD